MSYCPYCGREVSDDMSFCPGCGASLNNEVRTYTVTEDIENNTGDYGIYITGLGSASRSNVIDLLEDVLGYTTASATNLVNNIPVQIAGNLSLKQAAVVAQAFEEYGVELSVTNGDDVEDISSQTSSTSLFNTDGSFLASAAVILATLGAVNRLRSINKPKKPSLLQRIFHSLFNTRKKPPVHIRRSIRPRNMSFQHVEPQLPRKTVRQQLRPAENTFGNKPAANKPNSSKPSTAKPSSNNKPGHSNQGSHGSSHGNQGGHGGRK
ncbi:MAG: zinc ribbon domain-containing protein [Erysipelotrichaceae bacterium]|nr:zinc ribbon domain-containing protein [Erysipelotrichaceae bacterium]